MTKDWAALGAAIKARRAELRRPQGLDRWGGPGTATVSRLERALAPAMRNITKSQLESALNWRWGAVDEILAGTASAADVALPGQVATSPDASCVQAIRQYYGDDAETDRAVNVFLRHKGGADLGGIAEQFGISRVTASRLIREGAYAVAMAS